jgi:predicted RNA-binding protein with PIN domain
VSERADADEAVVLPPEVRARVVALAAERLSTLAPEETPPSLRPFARFTPGKRARLAAGPLAVALDVDPVFRRRVAETVRAALPDLADAVDSGRTVPAAPPEDVGALAYLLRPDGWEPLLAGAAEQLRARASAAAGAATVDAVERLTEQLDAVRAAGRAQAEQSRAQLEAARAETAAARQEVASLRRRVRELGDRAAREGGGQRAAEPPAPGGGTARDAELRRLRARLAETEAALAAARAAVRSDRHASDVRLRVLLDAVLGAAAGLRRELALPPMEDRPADAVAADYPALERGGAPPVRGHDIDDPAVLDALLAGPAVHLLVDGYNVTKTGYGEQTLEVQRARLLSGLAGVAARTAAEITVVFDGVDRTAPLAAPAPRGMRVLFSRTGETADDVLRRLVAAEPSGRLVVVVTGDQEIVDDVRRAGARAVPSRALLRLLER